jgi:hypothetical protein
MTDINVTLAPHPFAAERICAQIPAGATVADMAAQVSGGLRHEFLYAFLDGDYIPRENWTRIRPKAGTVLTFRAVPMGGGGSKNPLRTILSLALTAVMPQLGGRAAGRVWRNGGQPDGETADDRPWHCGETGAERAGTARPPPFFGAEGKPDPVHSGRTEPRAAFWPRAARAGQTPFRAAVWRAALYRNRGQRPVFAPAVRLGIRPLENHRPENRRNAAIGF